MGGIQESLGDGLFGTPLGNAQAGSILRASVNASPAAGNGRLPGPGGANSTAEPTNDDSLFEQLTVRSRNALRRAGIRSNEQLLEVKGNDLWGIRNLGAKSLAEITALQQRVSRELPSAMELLDPSLQAGDAGNGQVTPPDEAPDPSEHAASTALWAEWDDLRALLAKEVHGGRLSHRLEVKSGPAPEDKVRLGDLLAGASRPSHPAKTRRLVSELRVLSQSLSALSVDDELADLLGLLPLRERHIVLRRRTISGPPTLAQLGSEFGVTRERVRQLQVKAERKLQRIVGQRALQLPRFLTAVDLLVEWGDVDFEQRVKRLQEVGLLRDPSSIGGLLAVWDITQIRGGVPASLQGAVRDGMNTRQRSLVPQVKERAAKLRRNSGAVSTRWLQDLGTCDDLEACLVWLGYAQIAPGWFWRDGASRDVVAAVARKVFSVAPVVLVRELRASLRRHLGRHRYPIPPMAVFAEVAERIPFLRVDGDQIRSDQQFDPGVELGGSELALFRYLCARGPVANFHELFEANRDAGFQPITLAVRLKQSPIIRRIDRGLYCLVGADFGLADVDLARQRVPVVDLDERVEFASDGSGSILYSFNAPAWLVYGGAFSAPGLRQLEGEWSTREGPMLKVGSGFVWGLDRMLEEGAVALGDRVELRFDTWSHSVATGVVKRA